MRKRLLVIGIVLLSILLAVYLVGCGGGGESSGTASGGTTSSSEDGSGGGNNGSTDGSTSEASATIGTSGGTVEVRNTSSPLYGVKVEIPAGALNNDTTITIKQVDSEPSIPDTAAKVSQTVAMKPDGTIFNKPVSITIPYDETNVSDENALYVYSYTGFSWESVTFKKRDTTSNTITALSGHFSSFAVLEQKASQTKTTFDPAVNGFKIRNESDPGNCAGMVSYAKWFFQEKECALYKAYDDNTAQEVAESAHDTISAYNNLTFYETMKMYVQSDENLFNQLIEGLKSGYPQILGIVETGGGKILAYHTVLVYRYDDSYGNFYIYDPDYPEEEKVIKWYGQSFQDYYLTQNKGDVDYIVDTSELYHPSKMETVFNSFPFYIAGDWNYSESGTVTCTYDGETETEDDSGSGTVTISQDGSNVSWIVPDTDYSRSGTVSANSIQVSGKFVVSLVSGVNFTQNSFTANGTICGDEITLSGSGIAEGTYEGMSFSCTGTSTAVFTRSSSSSTQKSSGEKAIKRPSFQFLNKSLKIFTTALP